ncbi:hypothetical protein [Solidesulfovibrio magneticus]|uniref:Uncharacterized protein n=1 Tax=Solidesulfovibrio magneticus (strain ATCC 700980 / DSM 13731 / RS-1) TaxID=573370 RepID=C4XTL2_SOLM1|nr:hypothetical protein [Solidesulfovibrio magneticus]BAH76009.1 hypothetical protein DMR_25180 [Solidesulfovibrio magneticus RS-1]
MAKAKFTDEDYLACRKEGLNQKQMALRFGISEARVSVVKRRCETALEAASPQFVQVEVLARQHDALERLEKLARQATDLVELFRQSLEGDADARRKLERLAGRRGELLKAYIALLGENRKMLELDNTIKKTKFDIERVMQFQAKVMEVLQRAAPDLARQVVEELMALDATQNALDYGLKASE